MPFPVSVEGSITLMDPPSEAEVRRTIERITILLERERAKSITADKSGLTFKGGYFRFVTSWNVLAPFGSGRIDVEAAQDSLVLRYRLSMVEVLMIAAAIVVVGVAQSFRSLPVVLPSLIFLVAWTVGTNYLVGRWRFRSWLIQNLITHRLASFPPTP